MTGVPARRTGWMCECGVKLHEDIMELGCRECGRQYAQKGGHVTPLVQGVL